MDALDVLDLLEKTSGKNDKIQILKDNKSQELSQLLHAAFAFDRKFHIKKFDAVCELTTGELTTNQRTHGGFLEMLDLLQSRSITGNAALQYVAWFFTACSQAQIKWYSRVIRKDLQAGFSDSTANKAGYGIPKFEVMLAKDGKLSKKVADLVTKGGWISKKLDGYRCLAVKNGDDVTLYSRNGKVYENFPSIIESIKQLPQKNMVLDGEIMSNDFNAIQQTAFSSKSKKTVGDVNYHVFDLIDYDEWTSRDFKQPASERFELKANLHTVFAKANLTNLQVVAHCYVTDMETIKQLEISYTEEGFEGAMYLPADCVYYLGRKSNKLMKFKTMLSMDCKVTSLYEGINKYEGMMGGITLVQENGINCDCGSGFNDMQRSTFWNDQSNVIDKTVEIKYQELTPDGVMRFPIFMRFRHDKN